MKFLVSGLCLCAMSAVMAAVRLGAPFTDGVVLQRDRPVRIWGTTDAGATVGVSFAGQEKSVVADRTGKWTVVMPPMSASKEGRALDVIARANGSKPERLRVTDVLVGEVWLASGQSNMFYPLCGNDPRFHDAQGPVVKQMTVKPFVRLATISICASMRPKDDLTVKWCRMTPQECDDATSAVAYYYALELANALDIPIAVISAAVCASRIEPWIPHVGFASVAGLERERDWKHLSKAEWQEKRPKDSSISIASHQPSWMWNGMVSALAPMTVRGMIWYQGCSNSHDYQDYCKMMHALYNGWSKAFGNPDLRLYFVQLAPWGDPIIPAIQEAQARFAAEEKNASMAVINDVGNLKDLHPNDKRTVARRLALHALRRDYGWDWVKSESPVLRAWKIENGRFVLEFDHADGFYLYNRDRTLDAGFEVAGTDGRWKKARIANLMPPCPGDAQSNGSVKDRFLVIVSDEVKFPQKLRYLHSAPWFGAVYNEVGLPLGAFHIEGRAE